MKNISSADFFSNPSKISPRVTFHEGSCLEKSPIAAIVRSDEGTLVVITYETPFHPRDYQWPDQPEDRGHIEDKGGSAHELSDVVFVGVSPDGNFYVDRSIPVKKNSPEWSYFVGHVIKEEANLSLEEYVTLRVDARYRHEISRAHSASHLMGPALNKALAGLWRKEPGKQDALGTNDFDQLAIESSAITELLCTDTYHIGKSLRKKGFSVEPLYSNLRLYEDKINDTITRWKNAGASVRIRAEGDCLASRRYWCSTLDGKQVEIPCGGTHVRELSEIGEIHAALEMPDSETLIIRTSVR
ncbi:MAG: hypothetical protein LBQ58_10340 [Synergistaceae bacterium]|jgi:alanyl-tRNA synthetase|nr:hypothetical protein [Synergistaceae bacterium]